MPGCLCRRRAVTVAAGLLPPRWVLKTAVLHTGRRGRGRGRPAARPTPTLDGGGWRRRRRRRLQLDSDGLAGRCGARVTVPPTAANRPQQTRPVTAAQVCVRRSCSRSSSSTLGTPAQVRQSAAARETAHAAHVRRQPRCLLPCGQVFA